ncbi:hypothetical protein ACLK1S_06795 [Escherichia coli]
MIRSHLEQRTRRGAGPYSEGGTTECCAANLFWRKGNVVYTPRLDQAGVNRHYATIPYPLCTILLSACRSASLSGRVVAGR